MERSSLLTKKKKVEDASLFELCEKSDIDGVKNFLKHGGDIFERSYRKKTALHVACKYNHHEIVKFLIKEGLSVNAKNKTKETPLFYSLASKDILETLLKNGANLNHCNINGETPLHFASRLGYFESIIFLINNGAVYSVSLDGETPLHCAAGGGHLNIVKCFIKIGYYHSTKTYILNTPLDYAVIDSRLDVVDFLVSLGAGISNKKCAFHHFCDLIEGDKNKIFQIFIKYGYMPFYKSFYTDELKEIFMNFFKIPKIYLLFCARERNIDSHFYKEFLPFDLFKEIFKLTRSVCLEHEWNTFLKNAK